MSSVTGFNSPAARARAPKVMGGGPSEARRRSGARANAPGAARAVARPVSACPEAVARPESTPEQLGARVLDAFHRLTVAEAAVTVAEARFLERLFHVQGHRTSGFADFGDCVREVLGMSPRQATDRRMLARLFAARPNVEAAFRAGRITSCQALAVHTVLTDDNEEFWIGLCRRLTVAELRRRVRAMRDEESGGAEAGADDEEEPSATISFIAPAAVAVAFDDAIETARRVLGVSAPRYRCIEAILAEAAPEGVEGESGGALAGGGAYAGAAEVAAAEVAGAAALVGAAPDRTSAADAEHPSTADAIEVRPRIRVTIDLVDRELDGIEDLIESDLVDDPHAIIQRLKALAGLARPLRFLTGRLLADIRHTGSVSLVEFARRQLKVSERTAWNLLDEARLFEDSAISAAYHRGRIGLGQAIAIGRVAPAGLRGGIGTGDGVTAVDPCRPGAGPESTGADPIQSAWIERAEQVTHRQFRREAAVFLKLSDWFPALSARHPGPMPDAGLEARLRSELTDRGWTREEIASELREAGVPERRGAGASEVSGPRDAEASDPSNPATRDPAEDPSLMRRIELLLDMLIVTAFDTTPSLQTFAGAEMPAKTIRVRAPEWIAGRWRSAIRAIRRERPALPVWACVTLLIRDAVESWEREDEESRTRGRRILDRDGWLCRAPGCTRRRDLQVHHITFRSRGGNNAPDNRITLCFVHHQILLHETGALAVRGKAPHGLTWTLGRRTLRGERYVARG